MNAAPARPGALGWIGAAIVVAAVVRLIGANGELWFDEIVSLQYHVRKPAWDIVSSYPGANNHVLYTLLAHASVGAFGESPFALRLPAVVFGIFGVAVFAGLARRAQRPLPAGLATLALALSPPHVFYSQDARGYTAFVFFAVAATLLADRLAHERGMIAGLGYAVTLALGLWTLLLMGFVVLGHALTFALRREGRALGWLALGMLLGAALYSPMAGDLARYYATEPSSTGHPLVSRDLWRELGPIAPLLVAGAVLAPLVAGSFARREPRLAALLLAPLAVNVALPWLRGQGVHPRSFVYALPIAYLLLAEALAWIETRWRALAVVAAAMLLAASGAVLARGLSLPKQPFRQALAYVAERRRGPEPVLGLDLAGKALRFYDPTVELIEDRAALERLRPGLDRGAWVLLTFRNQLRSAAPDLLQWVDSETVLERTFPAQIGDGAVEVRKKGTL